MNIFEKKIGGALNSVDLDVLQVNVGLKCNQSCTHCHLECSPDRLEIMSLDTMEKIVDLAHEIKPRIVDITGGAPELNPHLQPFVMQLTAAGLSTQVRTNLSVMELAEKTDYPCFYAENKVALVASLPCYLEQNVDSMRGAQCYASSIRVLKQLNALGYGSRDALTLDLVFNPGGPVLPPDQRCLEQDYKREMLGRHGIVFNRLLTITNLPIGRFMQELEAQGRGEEYLDMLSSSFNPATVSGLMCRHQVNIGWDGRLYDCDFNQALGLQTKPETSSTVNDFDQEAMVNRVIATGLHCLGCTAGAGSSCGGAIES